MMPAAATHVADCVSATMSSSGDAMHSTQCIHIYVVLLHTFVICT